MQSGEREPRQKDPRDGVYENRLRATKGASKEAQVNSEAENKDAIDQDPTTEWSIKNQNRAVGTVIDIKTKIDTHLLRAHEKTTKFRI